MRAAARRVGIVVRSDDPGTRRAAMSCALYHLLEKKDVKVFLDDSQWAQDDPGLKELLEGVRKLGGMVLICREKEELVSNLKEYFHPYLTQSDIAEIVNSRVFLSLRTPEIDVREFA